MQTDQIAIAILGILAVWTSQSRSDVVRRWACIFGLLGQPLWFYTSWSAEEWGLFAMNVLYALAWMRGLWVYWFRPARRRAKSELGVIQLAPEARK